MASRTNKYASLNFNDIYEEKKKINPSNNQSSFSGAGKTVLSNSRIHGNMLVLSRPAPKPNVPQSPPPSQTPPPLPLALGPSLQDPIQLVESDSISLRPKGRTGAGPVVSPHIQQKTDYYKDLTPPTPKMTNRFVPPHLRPGFVGREEKQQPEIHQKQQIGRHYGEEGRMYGVPVEMNRPGSGSGGTRPMEMKRPGSGGTRPTSSG